ncbi:MAG: 23S rRNA (adenine(2503)-C(2))-methyltransferase RlmN [Tepidanaerobacteraceae bacterium]|jgi:23S rRNA (adenine2503-C2)-methyltransferase
MKINLKGMSIDQLEKFTTEMNEPAYRAKQIFRWIYNKGKTQFDEMTDLPGELIVKLKQSATIGTIKINKKYPSFIDDTVKYVFLLEDGNLIEGVKMKYSFGITACISSQVGCGMGCSFCASTVGGYVRNLRCGEMVDQIIMIQQDSGEKVSRVVVMGSGEPLLNYDELISLLRILNSDMAFNISYRKITVSTCGIVPEIKRLANENLPITLAVSLHAPDDSIRNKLMPINKRYSILQLLDACKYYIIKTKRRVTFEYVLIDGINDSPECSFKLAGLLKDLLCHVNLIPLNPVKGFDYAKSNPEKVKAFQKVLEKAGISVTIRRELGADIEGACGQLRRSLLMR